MEQNNSKQHVNDLAINQEKLLTVKDEHSRLCFEMRRRDFARKSNFNKMQTELKQQRVLITKLEKQKSELVLQLRLVESESFSNKSNRNRERFMASLDELINLEAQMKRQKEELERCNSDVAEINKKIRQKRKTVAKAQRKKCGAVQNQRSISYLENRLTSSLHKYNQLLVQNQDLREAIESLLLTQSSFRRKYGNTKRMLQHGRKTLSEVVHSATVSYQTGESAKYKLNVIKDRNQVDQSKLEEKIKELKILLDEDKELKEFLAFKAKERESERSKLDSETDQLLLNHLQSSRSTLSRIQLASGSKDILRICKQFSQQEEDNSALFARTNALSLEMEQLHRKVGRQRALLEEATRVYKEQRRGDLASREEVEQITDKLRLESQELEEAADSKAEELQAIKDVLLRICKHLDQISYHAVPIAMDTGVADDNMIRCLEALEKKVVDMIRCSKLVQACESI